MKYIVVNTQKTTFEIIWAVIRDKIAKSDVIIVCQRLYVLL